MTLKTEDSDNSTFNSKNVKRIRNSDNSTLRYIGLFRRHLASYSILVLGNYHYHYERNETNTTTIQISSYCRTCFILFFQDIFNYGKIDHTKLVY